MGKKKETKWVMVETISQFRMVYMVEAPEDDLTYAKTLVESGEAVEFSQQHISEVVFSQRVVSQKEALKICDIENSYLSNWSRKKKLESLFNSYVVDSN